MNNLYMKIETLINNMIENYKIMNKTIEQYDFVNIEAVKSVFDFSISNLNYLMRLIGYVVSDNRKGDN